MQTNLILVDENDNQICGEEKLITHKKGLLHRAFSIIIFNSKKEMLLQKRAISKYHSGGLWTNACCSHPRLGEQLEESIHDRLMEEMGFDCALEKKFEFVYKVWFEETQLFEHEFDHVFFGKYDGIVTPNPEEADGIKWITFQDLLNDVNINPQHYTYWFKEIIKRMLESKLTI